jgi:uncharacterized protein (TIGR02001 family)
MSITTRGLSAALVAYCFASTAPVMAQQAYGAVVAPDPVAQARVSFTLAPDGPATPASGFSLTPVSQVRAIAPISDTASKIAEDEPGSAFTFTGNVALATQYRFRGVNLSGSEIAIQGGFDVAHASGLYAGTWASTLDNDTVGYGSIELDLYGGWTGEVSEGLTADVGFIAYTYPDAPAGDFDYYEVFANLAFTLGPAATTVGVNYDPKQDGLDFGGLTRDNLYIYSDVGVGIPDTPVTINAHLGYTDGSLSFEANSKSWDWSIGASMPLVGPLTAGVAYVDAEADVATGAFNPTSSAVVATLSAAF